MNDPRGIPGQNQGFQGSTQGGIGSLVGKLAGPSEGIARAASGGMEGKTPADAQRKSMGFFDFLKPIVGAIPGVGTALSLGMDALGAVQGLNAQNQAKRAAGAAQGAQGSALAGQTSIANQLAGQQDYSGIINAEKSGVNTFMRDQGGVANPGAVAKDMLGQNVENAISGVLGQRTNQVGEASSILGGTASAYNQIGQQAGAAAQGNPFSSFMTALQGVDWGGAKGGVSSPGVSPAGNMAIAGSQGTLAPPGSGLSAPNGLPNVPYGGGTGALGPTTGAGIGIGNAFPGSAGMTGAANNALPSLDTLGASKKKTGY
jgi:hypothetical protein